MAYTIERDAIHSIMRQRYGDNGGERVLFVGPPGTGKTKLAFDYFANAVHTVFAPARKLTATPGPRRTVAIAANAVRSVGCEWAKCTNASEPGFRHCALHNAMLRLVGKEPVPIEGYTPEVISMVEEIPVVVPEPEEPVSTGPRSTRPYWHCTLTSDTLESRIWHGLYPNKEGGMDERAGPGALAWQHGGGWIIDELHRGSADCHERIIGALDDSAFATDTTPLGTILTPDMRFGCIATQNAPSNVLADALRDRFHFRIAVVKPPTTALDLLDPDVRIYAERVYEALPVSQWEVGPRPSFRDCLSFTTARRAGIPDAIAVQLILDDSVDGSAAEAWLETLTMNRSEAKRNAAAKEPGHDPVIVADDDESVPFLMGKLAHPEVTAREDRRTPWRVEVLDDPNNGFTNSKDQIMQLPEGSGPTQVAIRLHESLHAAHTPTLLPDVPRRMAEEVRMDAIAYQGGMDVSHRHDGIAIEGMRATNHPGDEVLWYWQSALTIGEIKAALAGKIRVRKEAPPEIAKAFRLMVRRMGKLADPAAEWVAKLLADPTVETAEAAAAWHRKVRIPDPPDKGEGDSVKWSRVQPGEKCGGESGQAWVEIMRIPKAPPPEDMTKPIGFDDAPPTPGADEDDEDRDEGPRGSAAGPSEDADEEDEADDGESDDDDEAKPARDPGDDDAIEDPGEDADDDDDDDDDDIPVDRPTSRDWGASRRLQGRMAKAERAREQQVAEAAKERTEGSNTQPAMVIFTQLPPTAAMTRLDTAMKGKLLPFNRAMIHDHLKNGHGAPVKLRRGTRADGSTVLRPERWRPGDRAVFSARRRGGAIAIDVSGSMGWDWNKLRLALADMPGLTVLAHGSRPPTPAERVGRIRHAFVLCLLSDQGRWSPPTPGECKWRDGNGGDIEALQWLATQRGPRIWISDGQTHSGQVGRLFRDATGRTAYVPGHGHLRLQAAREFVAATMVAIARSAQIVRVQDIDDALTICRHQRPPQGSVIDPRTQPLQFVHPSEGDFNPYLGES